MTIRSFRTSSIGRRPRPTINDWEIGDYFGTKCLRGIINGDRVYVRLLWWANDRFGIARWGQGTEEVWKVGEPR